jgi:serine/threonine protein phosphatase PrpC
MPDDVSFKISVYVKTDVGMVRPGNEDSFLVLNLSTADTWTPYKVKDDPPDSLTLFNQSHYGSLLAVTDGMGGALAGEVASRLAVECVRDRMLELQASHYYAKFPFHERLRFSIELANLYIYQMSLKRPECQGMGATFTAVGLFGATAYFAQVGDSRAYVIRGKQVKQMTRDQSLVGQLVQAGHITEEEAEKHTYKNVILQALGAAPNLNVAVDELKLRDLDIVMLCSDGLSNKVRSDEMGRIVDKSETLKEACESLINLANKRGGEDNVTILVSQFAGGHLNPIEAPEATETKPLKSGTGPVTVEVPSPMRWGATSIPRDPDLPHEIDSELLDEEEDTLRPTGDLPVIDSNKKQKE